MAEITTLASLSDLEDAVADERPLWIFKHSLSCGISSRALRAYQSFAASTPPGIRFALVEIQRSRELSRAIELRFEVRHQSPQALLVDRGRVLWHGSHWTLDEDGFQSASNQIQSAEQGT